MNLITSLVLAICIASTMSVICQFIFYLSSYIVAAKIYQDPTTTINRFHKLNDARLIVVGLSWRLFYYLIHI